MHSGDAAWRIGVILNTIAHTDAEGILVLTGNAVSGDTGTVDLTLGGNVVAPPDNDTPPPPPFLPSGIFLRSRQSTTLCANIFLNESRGAGAAAGYRLERSDASQLRLEDFAANALATLVTKDNTTNAGPPTLLALGEPFAGCTVLLPTIP